MKIKFITKKFNTPLKIEGIENKTIIVSGGIEYVDDQGYIVDWIKKKLFYVDLGFYFRATNNRHEIEDIKDGKFTHSHNYIYNYDEKGLSVSDTLGYALLDGYKYVYRVKGKVIDVGGDGEPILDISTLEFLDKRPVSVNSAKVFQWNKTYFRKFYALLRKYGFTPEDYYSKWEIEFQEES